MIKYDLVPDTFSESERRDIERKIREWKEDPFNIPIIEMPIKIRAQVESLREHGEGQGHLDLAHILAFEDGHE